MPSSASRFSLGSHHTRTHKVLSRILSHRPSAAYLNIAKQRSPPFLSQYCVPLVIHYVEFLLKFNQLTLIKISLFLDTGSLVSRYKWFYFSFDLHSGCSGCASLWSNEATPMFWERNCTLKEKLYSFSLDCELIYVFLLSTGCLGTCLPFGKVKVWKGTLCWPLNHAKLSRKPC